MSGHGNDLEFELHFRQFDAFAAGQRMADTGNALERRAEHGNRKTLEDFRQAADVVAVVMGGEDGAEAVAAALEVGEYRRGIARIDHRDEASGAQQPDVVVFESVQGEYFSHRAIFSNRGAMSIQGFESWLETPAGQYVLNWEQQKHDLLVADIFGFNAVQLSLPTHDFLRSNRMPLRFRCDDGRYDGYSEVRSDLHYLPFAANSIDLVVMPHTLEFDANPHQVLREVERILVPEGQVIVTGFNPFSLWGARRKLSRRQALPPWRGAYLSVPRLKDWFSLLGFEMQAGAFGCYAPAVTQEKWLRRFQFMDAAGDRWWPIAGAVYIVQAIKRQHGMRLITPAWNDRKARAKALVTVAQKVDQ
jgi:SAM-dependent methyltransferase